LRVPTLRTPRVIGRLYIFLIPAQIYESLPNDSAFSFTPKLLQIPDSGNCCPISISLYLVLGERRNAEWQEAIVYLRHYVEELIDIKWRSQNKALSAQESEPVLRSIVPASYLSLHIGTANMKIQTFQ
jgi:hypothetical protein